MIRQTLAPYEVKSFAHDNLKGKYRTRYNTGNFLKFLSDPNQNLRKYDYEIIKDDTNTIIIVRNLIEQCPIVIKRYNKKNTWHALRRAIRRSRAENCWIYAIVLENLGVAVAPPVAFIQEYLVAGLKGQSWYLSEFVDGLSCLDQLQASSDANMGVGAMEQIIDTLQLLWNHHITHGDTKGNNILLGNDRVTLLDLDSVKMNKVKFVAKHRIRKDKERFLRNWKDPALYELAQQRLGNAGSDKLY
jgi:serine/threonine protein kinase